MTIGVRLIVIAATPANNSDEHRVAAAATTAIRPDIIDRNGEILATDIRTVSVFAEPKRMARTFDTDEAV
ncbi:hypothetical protein, partial [Acinetobacter baumannii]